MAVSSATYHIGLQIPDDAQQRIHEYATMEAYGNASLRIPAMGEFKVQLMTVESQSREDLAKIRRAFVAVQRELQLLRGDSFSIFTPLRTLNADHTVAVLRVRSCGTHLPGWTQQGSIGHLRRLFEMLTSAFQRQGIDPKCISPLETYAPYVSFARVIVPGVHFADDVQGALPEQCQMQWKASVMGLFVE